MGVEPRIVHLPARQEVRDARSTHDLSPAPSAAAGDRARGGAAAGWPVGESPRRPERRAVRRHRSDGEPPVVVAHAMSRGAGYHDVHLPEDPARAVVWRVIAEYLARWVPREAHVLEVGAGYCSWINAVGGARRSRSTSGRTWRGTRHERRGGRPRCLDRAVPLRRRQLRPGARVERDRAPRAGCRGGDRGRHRAAAAPRRPVDRHPAELPLRLPPLLRRLHAPLDLHPRVAGEPPALEGLRMLRRRAPVPARTRCARAGAGDALAGARLPALADQAEGRARCCSWRRRTDRRARRQDRQRRVSRPTTRSSTSARRSRTS